MPSRYETDVLCALTTQDKKLNKIITEVEGGTGGSGSQYSWQLTCSSVDGRQIKMRITNATGAASYFEINNSPVTDGSISAPCRTGSEDENYDTINQYTIVGSSNSTYPDALLAPYTFQANTLHEISYVVLQGTAGLKIGSGNTVTIVAGQSGSLSVGALITQPLLFTAGGTDTVISIQTLS